MKKLLISFLCALVISSIAQVSFASTDSYTSAGGLYVSGGVGLGILEDADFAFRKLKFKDDAFSSSASLGYEAQNGFRSELAISYQKNNGSGSSSSNGRGNSETWTMMGNVIYDVKNSSPVTPYVGAGVGGVKIDFDNYNQIIDPSQSSTTFPAAQAILGVGYRVNEKVGLFVDYKYIRDINGINTGIGFTDGSKQRFTYENNVLLTGVRYSFGTMKNKEPIVEEKLAEAAPVEKILSRSYLAFFDFDKYNLTTEAKEVVRKAWQDANSGKYSRIEVTGHTDRAGTEEYNMKLSRFRAEAVKRELISLGANADELFIYAKGESSPLVPTEDGVREPHNRRVEIFYTIKK